MYENGKKKSMGFSDVTFDYMIYTCVQEKIINLQGFEYGDENGWRVITKNI